MAQTDKKQKLNFTFVNLSDIEIITDPSHPIFDPRVLVAPETDFVENIRENGVRKPVTLVTRENLAKLGVTISRKFTVWDGRNRSVAANIVGIPFIKAEIEECSSIVQFLTRAKEDNTYARPETLDDMRHMAKRLADMGVGIDQLVKTFRKPASTVNDWLLLASEAVSPVVDKMIENGSLSLATAGKIVKGASHEEQEKVVAELKPLMNEALASPDGKSSPPTNTEGEQTSNRPAVELKPNADGKLVPVPTHNAVEQAQAKAKGKRGPKKEGSASPAPTPTVSLEYVARLAGPVLDSLEEEIASVDNAHKAEARALALGIKLGLSKVQGAEFAIENVPEWAHGLFRVLFPKK